MVRELPQECRMNMTLYDYEHYLNVRDRRLYLVSDINSSESDFEMSVATNLVDDIISYNREDYGIPASERRPIRLYINSPGGDIIDGFSLVGAIETSKTPVYTINIGQWSSMAFLIGITGHKRFSLPYMTFLMHDGSTFMFGSTNKAQDKMEFSKRFEIEVIKKHVLSHSQMKSSEYDALIRVEYYMLPEDALERGFIDEIIGNIDDII